MRALICVVAGCVVIACLFLAFTFVFWSHPGCWPQGGRYTFACLALVGFILGYAWADWHVPQPLTFSHSDK